MTRETAIELANKFISKETKTKAKPQFEDFFLNSIELEGKGVDKYVNYVEWKDGTPLTDEEMDNLLNDTDLHSDLVTYKCYGI